MNISIIDSAFKRVRWYEWGMFTVMVLIGVHALMTDAKHPDWYLIVNFTSSLAGLACIFLTAHASYPSFLFGMINTVLYCFILYYNRVYGTLALEVFYYLPLQVIAMFSWQKHLDHQAIDQCRTRRLGLGPLAILFLILAVCTFVCHGILVRIGGATALLDAMIVSIGLIAMVCNWKRIGEQYVLWIITDIIAVAQWLTIGDPIMLTKKSIYLIVALIGYARWRHLSITRNPENV